MPMLVHKSGYAVHVPTHLYAPAGYVAHPLQVLPQGAYMIAGGIAFQSPAPAAALTTWLHPVLNSQVSPISINHTPRY